MNEPRIVLFDLETLPNLKQALKVWPRLSQYPGKTMRASITSIACAGWKVLDEKKTHCINAWDFSRWSKNVNDDYSVCKELRKVLESADAIVTHNGKRFDWKFIQTRLLLNGLKPLPKIPQIDTCAIARANLLMFDNRLGTLGDHLVDDTKLAHQGWELWELVHSRDPEAMKLMTKYCIQDVVLLEKIMKPLRPFISNMPNYNLWDLGKQIICPTCGSTSQVKRNGTRATKTSVYQRYHCKACGSYFRTNAKDKQPRSL